MSSRTIFWKVGQEPQALTEVMLPSETLLEDMIVAAPRMLSDEWMLIGRQEDTGFGGRIDLLAIASDGELVLIELKRDKTPRDVVAQSLDYASWVEKLEFEDISSIYGRFSPGRDLATEFKERFGLPLDEGSLNSSHQIIIVAASLDSSTERIVAYLNEHDIPIEVLCFQVFCDGAEQFVSRASLFNPVHTRVKTVGRPDRANKPSNEEFYRSFGHSKVRSWKDLRADAAMHHMTALPGDGIVRIAVNHGGKRTSVSMDSAIWGLLVAHTKDSEAAREWVRASASAMGVSEVRSPSLSRRIQSAIITSCINALASLRQ